MTNEPAYIRLRNVFEYEIANNNLSTEVVNLMMSITLNQENFDAFHLVCAFLFHNFTKDFMESMNINTLEINLDRTTPLSKNEMN
jgi:hypothetical protein